MTEGELKYRTNCVAPSMPTHIIWRESILLLSQDHYGTKYVGMAYCKFKGKTRDRTGVHIHVLVEKSHGDDRSWRGSTSLLNQVVISNTMEEALDSSLRLAIENAEKALAKPGHYCWLDSKESGLDPDETIWVAKHLLNRSE
jgi:hypothetical protein